MIQHLVVEYKTKEALARGDGFLYLMTKSGRLMAEKSSLMSFFDLMTKAGRRYDQSWLAL